MKTNIVKNTYEELPADVFGLIRSLEVRDFLRNKADLDIFDKEQIILHSYISIQQKMVMLKQLADTGNEEEARLIREMHDILAEYLDQIYHPAVRTIFMLENYQPYLSGCYIGKDSELVDAYDTVEEMIKKDLELYSQEGRGMSLYGLASVVQVPQDEKLRTPFAFTLFWIGGKWQIKDIIVYDEESQKVRGFSEDTIFRFNSANASYPLPFENGSRLKLQLPFIEEPFYGILSSVYGGHGEWFHHLYDENDTEKKGSFNLSYAEIDLASFYSSLDWIERA